MWWFGHYQMARQLTAIHSAIMELRAMVERSFEELKEAIEHSTSVQRGAVELINGLADRLEEIARHPNAEEIRSLAHELQGHAHELASAIARHGEPEGGEARRR